jgi:hypothetical protein
VGSTQGRILARAEDTYTRYYKKLDTEVMDDPRQDEE